MMKLRKHHGYGFLKLTASYNAIIKKIISYKTEKNSLSYPNGP